MKVKVSSIQNLVIEYLETRTEGAFTELRDLLKVLCFRDLSKMRLNVTEREDLLADLVDLTLVECLEEYDIKKGVPFLMYFRRNIRWQVFNHRRSKKIQSIILDIDKMRLRDCGIITKDFRIELAENDLMEELKAHLSLEVKQYVDLILAGFSSYQALKQLGLKNRNDIEWHNRKFRAEVKKVYKEIVSERHP